MFLPRIEIKLQIGNIVIGHSSPNSLREYRFELRMHPIPTPTGKFFASFFQKRRENRVLVPLLALGAEHILVDPLYK